MSLVRVVVVKSLKDVVGSDEVKILINIEISKQQLSKISEEIKELRVSL